MVHNLQDPPGRYGPVTSVIEMNGRLYFGSIGTTAIGWAPAPYDLVTALREGCPRPPMPQLPEGAISGVWKSTSAECAFLGRAVPLGSVLGTTHYHMLLLRYPPPLLGQIVRFRSCHREQFQSP